MRNLIDLAMSSPRHPKPRFMFASSISSAQSWGRAKGPFPEEVVYDAGVAVGLGYGASKYVSERVRHKLLRGAWILRILFQIRFSSIASYQQHHSELDKYQEDRREELGPRRTGCQSSSNQA
jgi:hypothetical protein